MLDRLPPELLTYLLNISLTQLSLHDFLCLAHSTRTLYTLYLRRRAHYLSHTLLTRCHYKPSLEYELCAARIYTIIRAHIPPPDIFDEKCSHQSCTAICLHRIDSLASALEEIGSPPRQLRIIGGPVFAEHQTTSMISQRNAQEEPLFKPKLLWLQEISEDRLLAILQARKDLKVFDKAKHQLMPGTSRTDPDPRVSFCLLAALRSFWLIQSLPLHYHPPSRPIIRNFLSMLDDWMPSVIYRGAGYQDQVLNTVTIIYRTNLWNFVDDLVISADNAQNVDNERMGRSIDTRGFSREMLVQWKEAFIGRLMNGDLSDLGEVLEKNGRGQELAYEVLRELRERGGDSWKGLMGRVARGLGEEWRKPRKWYKPWG